MKPMAILSGRILRVVFGCAVALLFAGCATQKVDWSARVGSYTYDQAVLELGPPDKQAKLEDGTLVADWLTRRGRTYSYPAYSGYYGYGPYSAYGPIFPGYVDSTPDYFVRLTFDPDGKLRSWKKYAR